MSSPATAKSYEERRAEVIAATAHTIELAQNADRQLTTLHSAAALGIIFILHTTQKIKDSFQPAMLFTLKMVIMAGAARASPIDETPNTEATSIVPTGVIDIDISGGSDMGEISVRSGCSQGTCPDNKAPFDFMERFWQDES
ncbi:hypothetical protein VC83_08309 [Pseudogymnoascus destructans]|uniref:Uncharacterized protein n=1 Tax=Pseudogymnoascus destructans TaxID=655981 RepID=A0A177A3E0_9PEZI|nr:uncharacterized protein VC83_08309 [Pseudogymnoascus destructans]OAF55454.1 hypothetical protein VC83_08309 [Pseudogymnoascus destructans]